ncbi:receptor protein-tyrosine kinase CEPR1-like [Dendrobium catenatum]|uniref:Receptor-like protein kinase HSL1 n=1 Tax=Dendrobium catenatum TaxID=906689 RepID=A0A2I0V9J7_9ASPA|nr:receptor protein-tyrosine kinase CEPR1-like [Dendrobium catenatum]PKU60076.1 Receptor-like protein kinase HSL1 [Dendrobium catenatum]
MPQPLPSPFSQTKKPSSNLGRIKKMPLTSIFFFLFLLPSFLPHLSHSLQSQSNFLSLMQQSLSGITSNWNFTASNPCNFSGITCDDDEHQNIVQIDLSSSSLAGKFPPGICSFLPLLRTLRLGFNNILNGFPIDLLNCSHLEELNLTSSRVTGTIPDLARLQSLRSLDLSNNSFSGDFPLSITNLTNIEFMNFNQNPTFNVWRLPEAITGLKKLRVLILSTISMRRDIPPWIANMTWLTDLELSGNLLVGKIPATIGRMKNLQLLELYYNLLEGEIPEELGNLTELVDIDLSVNKLTGRIPQSLCQLPRLGVLQLYSNRLTGAIPPVLGNSTSLTILSVYRNSLSGKVPPTLGKFSELLVLELSENQFSGELPKDTCTAGKLLYFLVLDNQFSGELPENYVRCWSMLRFRVNNNELGGEVPSLLFGLPYASIIDLSFNHFHGNFTKYIENAKNLSALFLQNNKFSGGLPPEISKAASLVKIDLSNNLFSGPIPAEIGYLSKMNQLSLQGNKLDSVIPESLSLLKSLNMLNLSNNLLTGEIPNSLCDILPSSLDLSNNQLSGPVPLPLIKDGLIEGVSGNPRLCVPIYLNLTEPILPLCPQPSFRKRLSGIWAILVSAILSILGILLLVKRWLGKKNTFIERDQLSTGSSFPYDVTNFHKLRFDQHEIAEGLIHKNIVGHGGSGTVYKIELSDGESVAVKKLWRKMAKDSSSTEKKNFERELRAEVETLGSIRHRNIVKLYCYLSSLDTSLLVYEYMPNGNLWDALHNAGNFLNWRSRNRIALGVAQGLAYLHHDLLHPIIHRDIKSSNILLDADFEPKVADFGISKVLHAGMNYTASTTVIAGTHGYFAPEYAYSTKATTKCDVYSFGVVLMELITGKKPIEAEFGENKDIIYWVSNKMNTRDGILGVLDKRLSASPFKEEMIQMLRIAMRCTCSLPALRPSMNEVAQILLELETCKYDVKNGSSIKLKDSVPITKTSD